MTFGRTFAKCSRHISDYLESTTSSNLVRNRNISEVSDDCNSRNRNGQGQGNGSPHGAHGGGAKRQRSNRNPWMQACVDACNHITEKRYSNARYITLNGNESQKVCQKSKGRSKDADANPSNQISVSQVTLRKMSTKISTLSHQKDATNLRVDTLDDDTRPHSDGQTGRGKRSDHHCDNANRGIACGGMPGRIDRSNQNKSP